VAFIGTRVRGSGSGAKAWQATAVSGAEVRVEAWRVHDTGLVAAPGPFRRLPGAVRHHQGQGAPWPSRVVLEAVDGELRASSIDGPLGTWPLAAVSVRLESAGPPVSFVLQLPDAAHLLAAPADARTTSLLAALTPAS
jgi:hypothetical protein